MRFRPIPAAALLLLAAASSAAAPVTREMDVTRSTLTVRVFKAGLFSAFGHNHEIRAPISRGSFDESAELPAVQLQVDARQLQVLDPDLSVKDRALVQQTMLGPEVLDTAKFPEIRFRSLTIEKAGEGKWRVHGDLTLHGQTRPVLVEVNGEPGHYRGSAAVRQTDFGIKPVTVAGGAIKVKNEVRVEFEIVGR
jgi:polyisoprenoid-binding protein YceI